MVPGARNEGIFRRIMALLETAHGGCPHVEDASMKQGRGPAQPALSPTSADLESGGDSLSDLPSTPSCPTFMTST